MESSIGMTEELHVQLVEVDQREEIIERLRKLDDVSFARITATLLLLLDDNG